MKYGVSLKIDVTKIDKSKLFNGQKGVYLDATVFIDVDNQDQYGNNGMITQKADKGEQGAILGNATVFWNDGQAPQQQAPQAPQNPAQQLYSTQPQPDFDDSEIPF